MIEPNRPFRWDLVRPDHLGSLVDGLPEPDLWFLGDLVECAAKVLARSGNGELYFVGRSADSVFDLLGGALPDPGRLHQLPLSTASIDSWFSGRLHPAEVAQLRANLAAHGLSRLSSRADPGRSSSPTWCRRAGRWSSCWTSCGTGPPTTARTGPPSAAASGSPA
ncbi:hypothetical protein ACIRSS_03340 [Amycolatopsis sp. NPDC101161]|uniref:hypothetical protein n=1 Tax=Amycolatopsis sp. NPDC101161 TaxID=3363940 RepID=UPI0038180DFB